MLRYISFFPAHGGPFYVRFYARFNSEGEAATSLEQLFCAGKAACSASGIPLPVIGVVNEIAGEQAVCYNPRDSCVLGLYWEHCAMCNPKFRDILAMENPADRVCEGAVHVIKKFTRRAVVNLGRVRTNMPFHLRSRALRLWNC